MTPMPAAEGCGSASERSHASLGVGSRIADRNIYLKLCDFNGVFYGYKK